eukprot:6025265-Prorocentrum_lima.AAC.1
MPWVVFGCAHADTALGRARTLLCLASTSQQASCGWRGVGGLARVRGGFLLTAFHPHDRAHHRE